MIAKFIRCKGGATAIEYALISGITAIALLSGLGVLGGALNNEFQYITNSINNSWK